MQPKLQSMHSTQDTFIFIKELEKLRDCNNFLVSLDVFSVFTNIPLNETIELALYHILSNNPDVNISWKDLKKLFQFVASETHFYFNGYIYEHVDGVRMDSPLAPVLANFFMLWVIMNNYSRLIWLTQEEALSVLFYKRYDSDIFCMFLDNFLDFLSTRHKNMKLTIEEEED